MTDSLGSLLTAYLQEADICADDYYKISTVIFNALHEIDKQIKVGEYLVFPNGDRYLKILH